MHEASTSEPKVPKMKEVARLMSAPLACLRVEIEERTLTARLSALVNFEARRKN